MRRIIEQTAISCGMVKTPNPHPATKETAVHGGYRYHFRRAQGPHLSDETRKQTQPQVEDAPHPARVRWSLTHRDLPNLFLFAHHRLLYRRLFHRRGASCLPLKNKRRGPAPLVDDSAQELIEELAEENLPTERG